MHIWITIWFSHFIRWLPCVYLFSIYMAFPFSELFVWRKCHSIHCEFESWLFFFGVSNSTLFWIAFLFEINVYQANVRVRLILFYSINMRTHKNRPNDGDKTMVDSNRDSSILCWWQLNKDQLLNKAKCVNNIYSDVREWIGESVGFCFRANQEQFDERKRAYSRWLELFFVLFVSPSVFRHYPPALFAFAFKCKTDFDGKCDLRPNIISHFLHMFPTFIYIH